MKIVKKDGKTVLSITRSEYLKIAKAFEKKAGTIAQLAKAVIQGDSRAAAQVSSILDSALNGAPLDDMDVAALVDLSGLQNSKDPTIIDMALKANRYLSQS